MKNGNYDDVNIIFNLNIISKTRQEVWSNENDFLKANMKLLDEDIGFSMLI